MSLNQNHPPDDDLLPIEGAEDEYEVITSEEVDRVLDALDQLIAGVTSENIRAFLEEAADNVYDLVYREDELEGLTEDQDEAA